MSTFMQPEITQRQRWLEIDGLRLAEPDIADYNQDEIQYTGSGIPYDNADVTVIGDEGKKQPFKCTYHVEGFDEDISPLLFAS